MVMRQRNKTNQNMNRNRSESECWTEFNLSCLEKSCDPTRFSKATQRKSGSLKNKQIEESKSTKSNANKEVI